MNFITNIIRPVWDTTKFYKKMVQARFKTTDIKQCGLTIDPYEPISIDPEAITEWSRRPLPNHHNVIELCGTVRDGDWDINDSFEIQPKFNREYYLDIIYDDVHISNTTFYQSMVERFQQQVAWEETAYVQSLFEVLEKEDTVVWGGKRTCKNEILDRCREIDILYNSIAEQGYQTQNQLGKTRVDQINNEILVDIGRNGNHLLVDGKHRLCIAQILGLESIKVIVLVRHKNWVCENK